jgi:uncharacterized DUF497 family protein
MAAFLYEFDWDPVKAQTNFSKHRLDFERAATVFLDPFAVTIPDEEHSETEARWITLGKDATGHYALVVHTFEWLAEDRGRVRLISARRPTKTEIRGYEEQT